MLLSVTFITVTAFWLATSVPADDAVPVKNATKTDGDKSLAFFNDEVLPILEANCLKCHSGNEPKGELDLTTRAGVIKGGGSGEAAVLLDDVDGSPLVQAINWDGYEMPPTGKMSPKKIDVLTKWVKLGLPMPEKIEFKSDGHEPPQVNEETRNHWSFKRLQPVEVPTVQNEAWVANPIDAFILQKLEENDITPAPPAEPRALYRRLHYDLLGLPPSPAEVEQFAADYAKDADSAYTASVDRLLASPHYGEHWARYWLDLVRYAESNSFERDNPKPFVWRYRDYVIRSFNEDKPFDQFTIEQLAGDELPDASSEAIIATGYFRLGIWDDEPADRELAFYDGLDDVIATTSQGFLGLTMDCCRCHSHKLDPIPQADYYKFLAFFRNVKHYGDRGDQSVRNNSVCSIASPEEAAMFAAEKAQWEKRVAELRGNLDAVEKRIQPHLVGGEKDDFKRDSERLRVIREHIGKEITREEVDDYARIRKEWTETKQRPPQSVREALCVKESGTDTPPTHILARGNPQGKGDVVEPGFPEVLGFDAPSITKPADGESSGRRTALAKWIASPENPLTARVAVNRLWQWHFGRGIVRSTNNFGLQGDAPTHPELLDWLANRFIDSSWSMKAMHRLILTSNTYRMSSQGNEQGLAKDPVNNLFWRFDMRRLRAEEVRDSILAANGSIDLDTMYGESIYPTIPAAVLAGQSVPGANWHTSSPEVQRRRSIYIHLKRSLQVPLLASFDVAETDLTCPVRFATTQPTQALGMLNSEFVNEQAAVFAVDLRKQAPDDLKQQVTIALERTTQRPPTAAEVNRGLELIRTFKSEHNLSADEALKNFCLLALNLNEFVYLD